MSRALQSVLWGRHLRHFGWRRRVLRWNRSVPTRGRGRNGDSALRAVARGRSLGDGPGPVSRVPTLPVHEVSDSRSEPEDTTDALEDVRRPGLPELPERLDVDPGIGHGPEGRHEAERQADEEEQEPGGPQGAGPFRPGGPRASGCGPGWGG